MKNLTLISIVATAIILDGCQHNPTYERGAAYTASSKPTVAYTPEQARKVAAIRANNARISTGYRAPQPTYQPTYQPSVNPMLQFGLQTLQQAWQPQRQWVCNTYGPNTTCGWR